MTTNDEVLAGLRIIGAVARADGKITKEERALFTSAVSELSPNLPDGTPVEDLLTKESDLDADLAAVTSPSIRRAVFEVAYAMSASDGAVEEEGELLKKIRGAFTVASNAESSISEMVEHNATQLEASPVLDPTERDARVKGVINRRSLQAGVIGAIPLPIVTDIGVLLQVSAVIDDIALLWGQPLTRQEKMAGFGALISLVLAQTAAHSLIKLIPGWGTVAGSVSGALASYVVVGAVGRAVNYHFAQGGKTTTAELKKVFHEQKAEVKKSFEVDRERIEAARTTHAAELESLAKKLQAKEITMVQYETELARLLG